MTLAFTASLDDADPALVCSRNARLRAAMRDLRAGFRRRELWLFLGWRDVRRNYSRSILGPLWLTLSMGVTVTGLGALYAQIFGMNISTYLPFLALGFILWGLIGGSITSACNVYSAAAGSIRQVHLPLSLYLFQFMWIQVITFAHNVLIYVVIALLFGIWPGLNGLLFVPAFGLLLLNGIFCAMILGPLCARFRDIPMIVASVMQLAFFLTPILWSVEQLPDRAFFVQLNPFYHFVEIARNPLLGNTGTLSNWLTCLGLTAVMGAIAFPFFARYRSRIAYWA